MKKTWPIIGLVLVAALGIGLKTGGVDIPVPHLGGSTAPDAKHYTVDTIPVPKPFPREMTGSWNLRAAVQPVNCAGGPFKDCTAAQMAEYAQSSVQLVWNQGYSKMLAGVKPPNVHAFVPLGATGFRATGCETPDGETVQFNEKIYAYCPGDSYVYIGEETLWRLYQAGYLVPILALAHEYGHRLQHVNGVLASFKPANGKKFTDEERLKIANLLEPQADCAAGVWWAWALKNKVISTKDDPISQIVAFFTADNKAKGRDKDPSHGSPQERRGYFQLGLKSTTGFAACNKFTEHPLMPA